MRAHGGARWIRREHHAGMKMRNNESIPAGVVPGRRAVLYVRVSSKEQEREGFSIPAQRKLLAEYAIQHGFDIVREFEDVETAKRVGRLAFGAMVAFLQACAEPRPVLLVEKTDRLYRNIKD